MGWTHTLQELASIIGAPAPPRDATFGSVSTDTRTIRSGAVFFALSGVNYDGNAFVAEAFSRGACAAVTRTSSDAGPCLVVEDPLAALQQFAAWRRTRRDLPVIAITGSCGKTSSKDLAAALLSGRYQVVKTQGNLNNHIGCPLSLLEIGDETGAAVIEMGANHLGEIAAMCTLARPTESAITLIAPAHLEGFGTIENVAKAKAEIVEALPADGIFYVNADDEWCVRIAKSFAGEKIRYGRDGEVKLESCEIDADGEMRLRVAPLGDLRLPLPCRAHAGNVLLAIAIGLRHGVTEFEGPLREACASNARFRILTIDGVEVIDDAYNANPASMNAAIETLVERGRRARLAALGDMLELGEAAVELHRNLGVLAAKLGVDHLFVRGDYAETVVEAARKAGISHAEDIQDHDSMAEAIRNVAKPGDMVLVKGSRGMKMERVIQTLCRHEA